jgi:hypothetical protein
MAVFNGTSGDDSFVAPIGTNTINGGAGIDTVSFNFRLDATFNRVGNHLIVETPKTHLTPTRVRSFHAVRQVSPRE